MTQVVSAIVLLTETDIRVRTSQCLEGIDGLPVNCLSLALLNFLLTVLARLKLSDARCSVVGYIGLGASHCSRV